MEGEHRKRGRLRTPIQSKEVGWPAMRSPVELDPQSIPLVRVVLSFSPVDPSQRTESGSIQGVRERVGRGGFPRSYPHFLPKEDIQERQQRRGAPGGRRGGERGSDMGAGGVDRGRAGARFGNERNERTKRENLRQGRRDGGTRDAMVLWMLDAMWMQLRMRMLGGSVVVQTVMS